MCALSAIIDLIQIQTFTSIYELRNNRLDNTYYCEVCQRNHGFIKSEHEKHMSEHTDIMRVASMI
jgi:hypothetical protein